MSKTAKIIAIINLIYLIPGAILVYLFAPMLISFMMNPVTLLLLVILLVPIFWGLKNTIYYLLKQRKVLKFSFVEIAFLAAPALVFLGFASLILVF